MIHLCKGFYLAADRYSFKICTFRNHNGKQELEPVSWHCTIEEAVKEVVNRAVRAGVEAGEIDSLKAATDEMQRITQELNKTVAGFAPDAPAGK